MNRVIEINSLEVLGEHRAVWEALLRQTPDADFFRTLDWLEVYMKHFGQGQRLRTLWVYEDDRPTGILPLVVRPDRTKAGTFRVLTYPLDDWGSFYGPLGERPNEVLRAGLQHIVETERDWDYLELRWVASEPDEDGGATQVLRDVGLPTYHRRHVSMPIADLSGGWDEYWNSRTGNWRGNCRRNSRKLRRSGRVEYVRHRTSDRPLGARLPRWDLYDACEEVALGSWQGNSTNGTTLSHASISPFLRDVHLAACRSGCIDLNLLMVDDRPAAFQYNYAYRGYVSGLRLGFHPDFKENGPGTVLMYEMLRDSCERNDHTFDMLPGSLPAKRNVVTSVKTAYCYTYIPRRLGRVQLLRLKRWIDHWRFRCVLGARGAPWGQAGNSE